MLLTYFRYLILPEPCPPRVPLHLNRPIEAGSIYSRYISRSVFVPRGDGISPSVSFPDLVGDPDMGRGVRSECRTEGVRFP